MKYVKQVGAIARCVYALQLFRVIEPKKWFEKSETEAK